MILVPWTAKVTALCEAYSEGQDAIEVSTYSFEYEVGKLHPELADGPRSHLPALQAHPPWSAGSPEAPGRRPAVAAAWRLYAIRLHTQVSTTAFGHS